MEVAHRGPEQKPANEAQHRIAQIAMQRRHGARTDAALEAVAHDQRIARAQLLQETLETAEVVAVVGVAHDDVAAARRGDAGDERRAVAALLDRDHARAGLGRERARVVARAVVRDEYFAVDAGALEEAARLLYAPADRGRLVQARHEDRELRGRLPSGRSTQKKRYPEGYLFLKLT